MVLSHGHQHVGIENKLDFRNFIAKLALSLGFTIFVELLFISSSGASVVFLLLCCLIRLGGQIKPGWSVSILFKFILSSFLLMWHCPVRHWDQSALGKRWNMEAFSWKHYFHLYFSKEKYFQLKPPSPPSWNELHALEITSIRPTEQGQSQPLNGERKAQRLLGFGGTGCLSGC